MKKIILIAIVISLMVFLAGCSETGNEAYDAVKDKGTVTVSQSTSADESNITAPIETEKKEDIIEDTKFDEQETTDVKLNEISSEEQSEEDVQEEETQTIELSSNIEDYTIEDIEVFIGDVVKESEYYYGPSEAFEIYKDIVGEYDWGHPVVGCQAIVYGRCVETGWWRLDLGRSGDYPVVYVPGDCVVMP